MNHTITDFKKEVIEESYHIPVVVDFWAEWCGPCKMLGPVLEKLAAEQAGMWKLVKIDTDEHQELAYQLNIRSIPAVKLFIDGKIVDEFNGALPEHQLRTWLKTKIPTPQGKKIDEAIALLQQGNIQAAEQMFIQSAEQDGNTSANVYLAKIRFFDDVNDTLARLQSISPEKDVYELHTALCDLGNHLKLLLNPDKLPESLTKPRFQQALQHIMDQQFDMALKELIEIIRDDRYYHDDAARKVCIALFKYLGEENPVTLAHRRSFGSALYV